MDRDLRVSLDRIEDGIAVLITIDSCRWLLPCEYLPEDASEGDILRVSFSRDEEATLRQAEKVRELQDRLLDRTGERHGEDE